MDHLAENCPKSLDIISDLFKIQDNFICIQLNVHTSLQASFCHLICKMMMHNCPENRNYALLKQEYKNMVAWGVYHDIPVLNAACICYRAKHLSFTI